MNPISASVTSLVRALAIAVLATLVAYPVAALLTRTASRLVRRLAWVVLLAPFLTPGLIVGYAYADSALSIVHHPVWKQVLYLGLVLCRFTPVAVLAVLFAPAPPLSAEAVYCHRMLRGGRRGVRAYVRGPGATGSLLPVPGAGESPEPIGNVSPRHWQQAASGTGPGTSGGSWRGRLAAWRGDLAIVSRGPARTAATALALTFLLAFQEFEIASLMNVRSWPVWLFDAQTGGLALGLSVLYALPPFVCEVIVLLPVALLLLGGRRQSPGQGGVRGRLSPARRAVAWSYLSGALVLVTVVPAATLLGSASSGVGTLLAHFVLTSELRASFLFGIAAALAAYLAARGLARTRRGGATGSLLPVPGASETSQSSGESRPRHWQQAASGTGRMFLLAVCAAPGLFGALIVGLAMLYLFQRPVLHYAYNTPLPLLLAMILLLMAPALLLVVLFDSLGSPAAAHAGRLLLGAGDAGVRRTGRRVLWDLRVQPQLWVFFLLFFFGYFDLTSPSLLAPPDLMPITVLLFNLMHYGRNAALSADTCIALSVPVMLLLLVAAARWWGPWAMGAV